MSSAPGVRAFDLHGILPRQENRTREPRAREEAAEEEEDRRLCGAPGSSWSESRLSCS